jgi:hypothetical protein
VLPGGSKADKAFRDAGAKLGDIAMVYNLRTRKMAGAVWADIGPYDKLGEGSILLAQMLGYTNTSPRAGGTVMAENVFVVFPGSGNGFPNDLGKLQQDANGRFFAWGGPPRLGLCAAQLGSQ